MEMDKKGKKNIWQSKRISPSSSRGLFWNVLRVVHKAIIITTSIKG